MTVHKHIRRVVAGSVWRVFRNPGYLGLAVVAAVLMLGISIWLPNLIYIVGKFQSHSLSWSQKINLAVSFLGGWQTNFTLLSRVSSIIVSGLFGIYVAVLVYYLRIRLALSREAGLGLGGMTAGLFGLGCVSCGSVVLSAVFGLSATAGFLGVLPLRGREFTLVGVGLLLTSIYLISRRLDGRLSCRVDGS